MTHSSAPRHLAIIGGLGRLAGADLHGKLLRTLAARGATGRYRVTFEQSRYERGAGTGAEPALIGGRKLYLYDSMELLEQCRADGVLLPCFISHTFLDELQAELHVPVLNMMTALARHLDDAGPRRLGVLCTSYVRERGLFERYFGAATLLYPSDETQAGCVLPAMYGDDGVLAGHAGGAALERLHRACEDLLAQGAELIVPGASEIAVLAGALRERGLPVVDSHQVYVDHALAHHEGQRPPAFKLGIIGGIGPAATVDFMQKIIRNTSAERDQDHIRLIVDHNPQIPDRTANLVGQGADPTLALYSACKRLEANGAALIAMPCNTAHAYVARLQPGLSVPIVNMLSETVRHIGEHCAGHATVGLLATTGTVDSGVYHEAARGAAFELIVPDAAHQALVMEAIYGKLGVKAGHVDGACREQLLRALAHLAERGATVVILGCTELPLLLPEHPAYEAGGRAVVLLDPTAILARRCVALSAGAGG
ncbi:aspartate/glutamate racemase family protein [Pseudoduganella namucuonensis]|uniref:Aspartate racemase n=1 Tax=Pseudoduganella namucuonensis TaxID=1035707 RepID=A0A1I7F3W4_9BURK|nr:amino acid racemase [Pseudoduganella namucuonensis]SFU30810.1 aspartate racemase [Pseudoduganella namucuonensis]